VSGGAPTTAAQSEPGRGHTARRERLLDSVKRVASISELPVGRIDALAEVREVLEAADELARLSELERVFDALDGELEQSSEAGRCLAAVAKVRADDRLILGHGDENLGLLRVDFTGKEAGVPELEAALRPTADGSLWVESTREGEQVQLAFAGEFQFIVGGEKEVLEGLERQLTELSTTRQREEFGLHGEILMTFALGVGMRAAWGSGMATLTDQRLVGVIFDDEIQGRPQTKETAWMPSAGIASDVSSVIAFDIPRASVAESEVIEGGAISGIIGRRIPYANLYGDNFGFSCQTVRILDAGYLVRPKKDVLGSALRAIA
jgi:hypothetical protein